MFRKPETAAAYLKHRMQPDWNTPCVLCERKPLHSFKYWKVITNDFPYDAIASRHDLLVTLQHTTDKQLTPEELQELQEIKTDHISKKYDYMMESMPGNKTIPEHHHLHLINQLINKT